jgi:hypothetical protein
VFAKALDDSCILYGVLELGFNGAMAQGESEMIVSLFIEGTSYLLHLCKSQAWRHSTGSQH